MHTDARTVGNEVGFITGLMLFLGRQFAPVGLSRNWSRIMNQSLGLTFSVRVVGIRCDTQTRGALE
jgi:hypothetical protein